MGDDIMEKVKVKCGACGEEKIVRKKPEPQNASEARQIYFHCSFCGIRNFRDGTFSGQKFKEEQEIINDEAQLPLQENLKKQSSENGIINFFKWIWNYEAE